MATTTATITLTSSDIADNNISISNTATLTKAGVATGLDQTSGLRRRTLSGTPATTKLIDLDYYQDQVLTENKATKVYIKNTGTSTAQYVKVSMRTGGSDASEEIGWLYGGDWMLFPYAAVWTSAAHVNNQDIDIIASNTDSVTLEYMVLYE